MSQSKGDEVRQGIKNIADKFADKAAELTDKTVAKSNEAKDYIAEKADALKEKTKELSDEANDKIQDS